MARCEDTSKVEVYVDGKRHNASTDTIEYDCPWNWAPKCKINSHMLTVPGVKVMSDDQEVHQAP